jgi:MFS family permease
MIAVALLYRYADFVTVLGGSELHLGWIVGIGMVGSLIARLLLGSVIDNHGARCVWLAALALLTVCCLGHLLVTGYGGPAIYVLRILYCCSLAGIFGASMTFVSGRAPAARMAEMLGMLGTSGFIGTIFGTQIGDMLCGTATISRFQADLLFLISAAFGAAAWCFAWLATRGQTAPAARRRPPVFWILRRYQPGTVLLVSAAMGVGVGLPAIFLRTYAAELDIARIGLFFLVYSPTAIVTRVVTRRLPERFGLRPMIVAGMMFLLLSQFVFLAVRNEWTLILPGFTYGVGHAILFPTTIALGSGAFPNRYRGLGTTLMLAAYDFGQLIGAPTTGWILHSSASVGLPGYPVLFCSVAAMFAVVAAVFVLATSTRRRESATPAHVPLASPKPSGEKEALGAEQRLSSAP